jgi:Co/Zn/Cd efflux system component
MMVIDPVIGVSIGTIVFDESFAQGLLAVVQVSGLVLTLAGVWLLATDEQHSRATEVRTAQPTSPQCNDA